MNKKKITTTLSEETMRKIRILSAYTNTRHINDFIETLVQKEWRELQNDIGIPKDIRTKNSKL